MTSKAPPSDFTARQLLQGGHTLNQVDDYVADGRVSIEIANEFFREWCVGKLEHRWNAALNQPEQCRTDRRGNETWTEMLWG